MATNEISVTGGLTQQQCAELLGCTRSHVHYLEQRAIKKMRAAAEAEGWKLEDVLREVWR